MLHDERTASSRRPPMTFADGGVQACACTPFSRSPSSDTQGWLRHKDRGGYLTARMNPQYILLPPILLLHDVLAVIFSELQVLHLLRHLLEVEL